DLQKIGMHVNVVTLDFPSLIERMTQTFDYEAILLGLTNVGLDPNEEMNVWLSSSENHQWNPQQKTPETAWEAEIDRLMRSQASGVDAKKRKESFDRVQEIVVEQAPFIFLVNRNALSAVSSRVQGATPVILRGEILGLVGQSGSGKSTLAMTILGLLDRKRAHAEGTIQFLDCDLLKLCERELRSLRGRKLALVLQSPLSSLNPALKIRTQ